MSNAKLTTAKIRRAWKEKLVQIGFRLERSLFVRDRPPFQQVIGVQRNLLSPTWKINLYICLLDPFSVPPAPVICLHGSVAASDAGCFEKEGSWWPESELPGRLDAIIRFGIPWLDGSSDAFGLIRLHERAIKQCTRVELLLEPRSNQEFKWPSWIKTAYESPPTPPRPAPIYFHHLSLIYHAVGDFENASKHASMWLDHVRDGKRRASRLEPCASLTP